ncbi:uncharacterized protein LOC119969772 isoform X1 [Scyliorhinus canicula]|uniref:uncharacterized protein LOC119969772 isoform X1 n=1 Tax=Scyliorhinus canicula TaxID=7830 RepID=UPI0018F784AB|nr:uncharacterized protein LOC119969772 isoform X1 [Scyliorhinus canicula]
MDSRDPCRGAMGQERSVEDEKEQSVMIWRLEEAEQKQIVQIGSSACGATAVLNVLQALRLDIPAEVIASCVQTRLRKNDAPLAEYLISRSVAGATHQQLIEGAERATEGGVVGKFFSFFPERHVQLTAWLAHWMRRGAVAVLTMNMQVAVPRDKEIPDAWHHQMIFGVDTEEIYMTNPLEIVKSSLVKQRLSSQSLLLIRRHDILARLSGGTDFSRFKQLPNHSLWEQLDVAGQIAAMISGDAAPAEVSDYVVIPAAYRSGVTLFTPRHSELASELLSASELPLLH